MGVSVLVFAVEQQKLRIKCIWYICMREDFGEFQNRIYVKGEKSI